MPRRAGRRAFSGDYAQLQGLPFNVRISGIGNIGPVHHMDGTISMYDPIEREHLSHVIPTHEQLIHRFGSLDQPGAQHVLEHTGQRRNRRNPTMARRRNPGTEKFREPDVKVGRTYAIWYGPAGADGDVATEVEQEGNYTWKVSEYQSLVGYVDDLESLPGDFRVITVYGVKASSPAGAAAKGTQIIAYKGGDEDYADSLPR